MTTCLILAFFPCVTKPTRFNNKITRISTSPPALLDHIFCSSHTSKFAGILIDDISDHLPLLLIDQLKVPKVKNEQLFQRDVSDKNIEQLCEHLREFSWDAILSDQNPKSASNDFFSTIATFANSAFPLKLKKVRKEKNIVPWYSSAIATSAKKKRSMYLKLKKVPSQANLDKYRNYRRVL